MNDEITLDQFIDWLKSDDFVPQSLIDELIQVAEKRLDLVAKLAEQDGTFPAMISERIAEALFYGLDER